MISGAVKAGVPQYSYSFDSRGVVMPARPKSATLTRRLASISTFSGFRSLWMTCLRAQATHPPTLHRFQRGGAVQAATGGSGHPSLAAGAPCLTPRWSRGARARLPRPWMRRTRSLCTLRTLGAPSVAVVHGVHHLLHDLLRLVLQEPGAALHRLSS